MDKNRKFIVLLDKQHISLPNQTTGLLKVYDTSPKIEMRQFMIR